MANRLILIDGHAVIFRAFYAYPPLTTSTGELVNAVYGFTSIVLNVIRELAPTHIALSFDLAQPTFRHKEFNDYKANRAETPQELIDQVTRVREVVETFNIPTYTKEGYEADDVIGTICEQVIRGKNGLDEKTEVIIVTGDKDALQLVIDETPYGSVGVYIPGRNKLATTLFDESEVIKKFEGLKPLQVIDFKGLAGDQSDNIPGVKGVGSKTAIKLLNKMGTIEEIYAKIDAFLGNDMLITPDKLVDLSGVLGVGKSVVEKLIAGKESAIKSKKLATIIRDVPLDFQLQKAILHDYDKQKVLDLFTELGFASLAHKLPNDLAEQHIQEALF